MRQFCCLLFAAASILVSKSLYAQSPSKESLRFAYLEEKSVEFLEITRERIFEGPGLYGFMNGGSDLFLEYGFIQLLEQRLTFKGVPFIAEYYLMSSPENAYGIYSVHAFRCRRADDFLPIECLTTGLLQFCHGNLYISLKCLDRTNENIPLLDTLSTLIIKNNPYNQLDFINFPPPYSGMVYYVCGDLGLSAAYISWAPLFTPYPNYALWLCIEPDTKKIKAQVNFASENDAKLFCDQNEERFLLERNNHNVVIWASRL